VRDRLTPGFFPEQNRKLLFQRRRHRPTARTEGHRGHTPMGRFGSSEELVGAADLRRQREGEFVRDGHGRAAWTAGSWRRRSERSGIGHIRFIAFRSGHDLRRRDPLTDGSGDCEAQAAELDRAGRARRAAYRGKKVLLIIPGRHAHGADRHDVQGAVRRVRRSGGRPSTSWLRWDASPMPDAAICQRLEITLDEWCAKYSKVRFFNHEWDNPAALRRLGVIPADEISALSGGLFAMDVPVDVNARVFDYDEVIIVGPVFPHEVVGMSGGNKYLFPGVGGADILNFFHWLGAVVTNLGIIGNPNTPVRAVVDRAGAMVNVPKKCFALVAKDGGAVGVFAGTPESAWAGAAALSAEHHIVWKDRPFHTVLSCAIADVRRAMGGGQGHVQARSRCWPRVGN
jgi:hypothetical protein